MNHILLISLLFISTIIVLVILCIINKKDDFDDNNDINNKFVLITDHYVHKDQERYQEICDAIKKNIKCSHISKILLCNENKDNVYIDESNSGKIINYPTNKRSTFYDFFKLANTLSDGTFVIISNNDISFDKTLININKINLDNVAICLGRRDTNNINKLEHWTKMGLSHDSWIFKTPIKTPEDCNFYLGTTACDRHLAYLLDNVGYKCINPCHNIVAQHHHKSENRKWVSKPSSFNGKYKVVPVLETILDDKSILNKKSTNSKSLFSILYRLLEYWT